MLLSQLRSFDTVLTENWYLPHLTFLLTHVPQAVRRLRILDMVLCLEIQEQECLKSVWTIKELIVDGDLPRHFCKMGPSLSI